MSKKLIYCIFIFLLFAIVVVFFSLVYNPSNIKDDFNNTIEKNGWNNSTFNVYNSTNYESVWYQPAYPERDQSTFLSQVLNGKAIIIEDNHFVWDEVSPNNVKIPQINPLLDSPSNATILIHLKRDTRRSGSYTNGGSAYSSCVDIHIFNLTEKKEIYTWVFCNPPPEYITGYSGYSQPINITEILNKICEPNNTVGIY